ncbi:MAG TPA: 1-(5-phosphoribosyl)-5-((5-phosphoribosylamino)methylideneamino)imidazole-4-carboxamide isomerase [Gammaproteobacteria bacterium]|nr:1-(5-phosphoribosyl)-5-((5-phosphoribosylamino)methylideneamino)imidazole-4-carboxamide isomerase [Gammaproteobacteria bacterium]|tara:strand:+ start:1495 stop:1869 length:375 start_codon:yes stop_codon:yes gene_type:complete
MIPTEITIHKKSAVLELVYDDQSYNLSAEYLRVFSPSAEVQGHSPSKAVLQHGKRDVQFKDIEPQGNYALKLIFSDGHDSGIYSWDYLYELATNYESNWTDYEQRLKDQGKTHKSQLIAVEVKP